jgi:hypothetical protein
VQGAVEVGDDRGGPRHNQLARRVEKGVPDPVEQRRQALAGRQRRLVVAHLEAGRRRRK